jgi:hypothetical protein
MISRIRTRADSSVAVKHFFGGGYKLIAQFFMVII